MPQLHFYVPEPTAAALRERARSLGQPLSKYLAGPVRRELGGSWPEGFFTQLPGGWAGGPLVRAEPGEYERREPLRPCTCWTRTPASRS